MLASERRRAGSPVVTRGMAGAGSRRSAAGPGEIAPRSARRAASSACTWATVGTATAGAGGSSTAPVAGGRADAGSCAVVVRAGAGDGGSSAAGAATGGGMVGPVRRSGGDCVVLVGRSGSCTPVGGAFRARRGGNGGKRRPHAWHVASSSAFSALQNGQNLTREHAQSVRPIAR